MVLIDRKKLEEQIRESFEESPAVMGMLLHWVRKQKAVDAVPVVHGEWEFIPIEFDYHKDIRCSHCKTFAERISNYCPNCGAKMDGGAE